MKFSVMSRKAKPTARPAIDARPRIDSTIWVRPSAPRASRQPPRTSSELMTEPRTDRSSTLPTNGDEQDLGPGREQPRQQRRGRHDARRQEDEQPLATQVSPQPADLPRGELPGRHHLLVGLHVVEDQPHALDSLHDVGDLVQRLVAVGVPAQLDDALVHRDLDRGRRDTGAGTGRGSPASRRPGPADRSGSGRRTSPSSPTSRREPATPAPGGAVGPGKPGTWARTIGPPKRSRSARSPRASLALEVQAYRDRKAIGAFAAALRGCRTRSGSPAPWRSSRPRAGARVPGASSSWGSPSTTRNAAAGPDAPGRISPDRGASGPAWVVPADEERQIAREVAELLGRARARAQAGTDAAVARDSPRSLGER